MKFRKLSILIIIAGLSYLLDGCGPCPGFYGNRQPSGFFTIPNLYSVINPKDTFHLNDTLWVRFQVPDTFSSSMGTCDLKGDTLSILASYWALSYANNTDTPILSKPLFFQIGNKEINYYWNLQRSGTYYVAEFGLILDNKNIIGIGTGSDTGMVFNYSRNTPCRRLPGDCPLYYSGFFLNTTFQNGQRIYPLIVR